MQARSDERENPNAKPPRAFEFGRNWQRFISSLNDSKIKDAEDSICSLLRRDNLLGCSVLDAGSGSGLFSLAASRLGAKKIVSFDVDKDSFACTEHLKRVYGRNTDDWDVKKGSLLDHDFIKDLGQFDIVYCWGVAHHSGRMWSAIENLSQSVMSNGLLVLAIYNDQSYISRGWAVVKKIYQRLPPFLRVCYVLVIGGAIFAKRMAVTMLASLLRLLSLRNPFVPFVNWMGETQSRGMHGWYNLVDWVGGWPFEVAKPEEVFRFLRDRGFSLMELTTSSGHGCNEFVFQRNASGQSP